jgi:hypothetical protein
MLVRNVAVIVALLVLWLSPNAGSIARRCHIVNVLFQRLFIGVGLLFLTSGCTVGQADTATPAASTPPAVTVSPTVAPADATTPAAAPTSPVVATSPAGVSFPALLVIDTDQRTLMEYRNGQAQQRFADLTEGGTILDGMVVADAVVILQEEGLRRIRLTDGDSRFQSFNQTVRSGALIRAGDDAVIYEAKVDDPQAEFGVGTAIGLYRTTDDSMKALLTLARNVGVLHMTADQQRLFLLPFGQDPSFGALLIVNVGDGQVLEERTIEGELFATISPDGRRLVTTSRRAASAGAQEEGVLLDYDLTASSAAPQIISLPKAPGHAWRLTWSPDSRALYFLLRPGDLYDEPATSFGVWRLDAASRVVEQVTDSAPVDAFLRTDGQWLMLQHSGERRVTMINLATRASTVVDLPTQAIVVGWR